MNPCTAIVYNQTDNNMVDGSLWAAEKAAHNGPDGLFRMLARICNPCQSSMFGNIFGNYPANISLCFMNCCRYKFVKQNGTWMIKAPIANRRQRGIPGFRFVYE